MKTLNINKQATPFVVFFSCLFLYPAMVAAQSQLSLAGQPGLQLQEAQQISPAQKTGDGLPDLSSPNIPTLPLPSQLQVPSQSQGYGPETFSELPQESTPGGLPVDLAGDLADEEYDLQPIPRPVVAKPEPLLQAPQGFPESVTQPGLDRFVPGANAQTPELLPAEIRPVRPSVQAPVNPQVHHPVNPPVYQQAPVELPAPAPLVQEQSLFAQKIAAHPFLDMKLQRGETPEVLGAFTSVVRRERDGSRTRYIFEAASGAYLVEWQQDNLVNVVSGGRGLFLVDQLGKGLLLRSRMDFTDLVENRGQLPGLVPMQELKRVGKQSVDILLSNFPKQEPAEQVSSPAIDYGDLVVFETKNAVSGVHTWIFVDMTAGLGANQNVQPATIGFNNLAEIYYGQSILIARDEILDPRTRTNHQMVVFNTKGQVIAERQEVKSFKVVDGSNETLINVEFLDGKIEPLRLNSGK